MSAQHLDRLLLAILPLLTIEPEVVRPGWSQQETALMIDAMRKAGFQHAPARTKPRD